MEFSREVWNNHKKGEATRQLILEAIGGKGLQSEQEISQYIGRSQRQTRRQISTLISQGRLIRINGRLILNEKITYMAS